MISRHWTGICLRDRADAYVHHLRSETIPSADDVAGFVRASVLKRDVERGTEFQIVTVWESLEAIKSFAGEDTEAAVVPLVAQAMMLEFDSRASHYEVVYTTSVILLTPLYAGSGRVRRQRIAPDAVVAMHASTVAMTIAR